MSYTYDQKHTTLIVEQDKTADGVTPLALVQMDHPLGPSSAIHVRPEDAPALALAILEAAGHGGSEAAGFVRGQVEALVKEAEREAEDAKVDAWRTFNKLRGQMEVEWKCLSDYERNEWRTSYRAARKFFQEAQ